MNKGDNELTPEEKRLMEIINDFEEQDRLFQEQADNVKGNKPPHAKHTPMGSLSSQRTKDENLSVSNKQIADHVANFKKNIQEYISKAPPEAQKDLQDYVDKWERLREEYKDFADQSKDTTGKHHSGKTHIDPNKTSSWDELTVPEKTPQKENNIQKDFSDNKEDISKPSTIQEPISSKEATQKEFSENKKSIKEPARQEPASRMSMSARWEMSLGYNNGYTKKEKEPEKADKAPEKETAPTTMGDRWEKSLSSSNISEDKTPDRDREKEIDRDRDDD